MNFDDLLRRYYELVVAAAEDGEQALVALRLALKPEVESLLGHTAPDQTDFCTLALAKDLVARYDDMTSMMTDEAVTGNDNPDIAAGEYEPAPAPVAVSIKQPDEQAMRDLADVSQIAAKKAMDSIWNAPTQKRFDKEPLPRSDPKDRLDQR